MSRHTFWKVRQRFPLLQARADSKVQIGRSKAESRKPTAGLPPADPLPEDSDYPLRGLKYLEETLKVAYELEIINYDEGVNFEGLFPKENSSAITTYWTSGMLPMSDRAFKKHDTLKYGSSSATYFVFSTVAKYAWLRSAGWGMVDRSRDQTLLQTPTVFE
ncbi:hypothetical protein FRC12_013035 [Ceratobasidium sp. 428]|nr:hypothetical protein FRC12_013035 [Ceratobasidium sp. 428]